MLEFMGNQYLNLLKTNDLKRFPILLGGLLLFLNVCLGQTTLTTTFTNNNGSGQVTFNFQNTNTYPVVISSISSVCGSNATQTVQAWYRTTPLTGLPGAPTAANGWIQFGSGTITGVLNNTTTISQVFFPTATSTLTPLTIPAGATYAISISATSLRYGNLTAGTYTATGGGCNLITGTNIGYGGTVAPNAATIALRGFIGSVTFIIPVATPAAPTLSNTPTCVAGAILAPTGLPASGVTWYWQTSATGTSTAQIAATSTTATNWTVFSNATYYLRAQDDVSGAWSPTSSITVSTIPTGTTNPPAPTAAINPACSPGTTITSSTAPVGTTYYWQTSALGTSTAQMADNGSTNTPLLVTTTGTYHVRAQDNTSLCWSAGSGSLPVTVLTPVIGTANVQQITSCGGAGSITVNVNSSSNTWYANDFSSTTMNATDAQLFGTPTASITGGTLVLTTAANTQSGAIQVNNPNGINSNVFTVDFDLITVGAQGADGLSYSFGGDVVPIPTGGANGPTTTNAENGSGSFLKLSFDAYTNGTNTNGVYLMYACTTFNQAPATAGVLGYSPNVSWAGGNNSHVNISVNALGQITVTLGNTVLFNNVQLPAAYLSANKSTWKHVICARTG